MTSGYPASANLGSGAGQFSAWLSQTSDTAGEPDQGTMRAIQTIFLELPFLSENYDAPYRGAVGDGSNGFHPSGDAVVDIIEQNFIPTAKFLIGHSATPGCNIQYGCPRRDFGLVGAKISTGRSSSGALETSPATRDKGVVTPARDYLATGRYQVWYRVQNFSSNAAANQLADVRVTIEDGGVPVTRTTTFRLDSVNSASVGVADLSLDRPDIDYTVTIEARPFAGFAGGGRDDFRSNDKKVFKFRS